MSELPGPAFWGLIEPEIGQASHAEVTERGFGSDLTAIIEGETGPVFVKAMRNRPGGRRDSILREREINPAVAHVISPPLLWYRENADWIVLGFEAIEGRRASFKLGSPDRQAVVYALNRIARIAPPRLDWRETRWDRFAANQEEAALFAGATLLHTDINPSNFMLDETGRTWLVDWAWPTLGAPFIDPALWAVQLIAAGHTVEAAESWASRCTGWAAANPRAITAFAGALHRMYAESSQRDPDAGWLSSMHEAARAWHLYRGAARS
ncbi:protein kinase [Streptomyces sp. NPDC046939]|uniref:phosphotransferase family protein n=1 Tax=Streptomyces sp. NPDC046939 TaxID=3155376 RepID=UPI0033D90899